MQGVPMVGRQERGWDRCWHEGEMAAKHSVAENKSRFGSGG